MPSINLTKNEIMQGLYCLEQMESDFLDETTNDYKDYSSLLKKLSKEIYLSKTSNLDALDQGIKHLDKAVYKNKNKPKTNQNETIKGT